MVGIDDYNISVLLHELRSPINILLGIVEETKHNLDPKEEVGISLDKIKDLATYLLSLSDNFLEIIKNENNNVECSSKVFKFKEIIDYIISVFNFQFSLKNIDFHSKVKNCDLLFNGDPIKIKQILINILSNSYKYTPSNGKVYFECSSKVIDNEKVEFEFMIRDNGIGMSKEFLDKVFIPYNCETNTIKPIGTGLGLWLVKENLDKMNGTIKIDSTRGVGTTVVIKFPLKIINNNFDFSNKKLLIVDDCTMIQQILTRYLDNTGAIIDLASDGEEALKKFKKSKINYYDLIIMDNKMIKLDGEIAIQKIREAKRPDARLIKIIGMTASNIQKSTEELFKQGMNDYLIKPISRENFLGAIAKLI